MNICVINGSPKGQYSITLQTILFLKERFKDSSFNIVNVIQRIKYYEKHLDEVIDAINDCDLVLFSYPVYTFIAPYQLQRFIELLKESDIDLSSKYAAQITTSKHFYDVTAHEYIKENCLDLMMKYLGGLSADMDDLLTKKGQEEAENFYKYLCFAKDNELFDSFSPVLASSKKPYKGSLENIEKKEDYKIVIVTNLEDDDISLAEMIKDFIACCPYKTNVINIAKYPFSGGCLGCFHCASTGICIYKDKFDSFLRDNIQTNDSIVYAFTIKDHSMGASFKQYDDRQFCNGHRTVTMGMPIGYIVNGELDQEANLKLIINGRAEVGHNYLAGIATSKDGIISLVDKLDYALKNKYVPPSNFLGVGGMKIFRDLIYLMRGMMKKDHQFYKKNHLYDDFPQKQKKLMFKMKLVGLLISNPKIVAKLGNKMNEGMIAPYQKVIKGKKK